MQRIISFVTALFICVYCTAAGAFEVQLDAAAATSTYNQNPTWTPQGSVDGSNGGWAIANFPPGPDTAVSQSAVFPTTTPVVDPSGGNAVQLTINLKHLSKSAPFHILGHFALSYTEAENPNVNTPANQFIPLTLLSASAGAVGTTFSITNNEIIVGGSAPAQEIYVINAVAENVTTGITGFRLDVIDANGTDLADINGLPGGGPGRAGSQANFVLSQILIESDNSLLFPTVKTEQKSGPTRGNDSQGLESFDLDGDSNADTGALIGIKRRHAQHYEYAIDITNQGRTGDFVSRGFMDSLPKGFALDPAGEAFADSGTTTGACEDTVCDGIIADASCPVTVSETRGSRRNRRKVLVIEGDDLGNGDNCVTRVFVVTKKSMAEVQEI